MTETVVFVRANKLSGHGDVSRPLAGLAVCGSLNPDPYESRLRTILLLESYTGPQYTRLWSTREVSLAYDCAEA